MTPAPRAGVAAVAAIPGRARHGRPARITARAAAAAAIATAAAVTIPGTPAAPAIQAAAAIWLIITARPELAPPGSTEGSRPVPAARAPPARPRTREKQKGTQ
jgi:hypothetical protein